MKHPKTLDGIEFISGSRQIAYYADYVFFGRLAVRDRAHLFEALAHHAALSDMGALFRCLDRAGDEQS